MADEPEDYNRLEPAELEYFYQVRDDYNARCRLDLISFVALEVEEICSSRGEPASEICDAFHEWFPPPAIESVAKFG